MIHSFIVIKFTNFYLKLLSIHMILTFIVIKFTNFITFLSIHMIHKIIVIKFTNIFLNYYLLI
jgi:hypothetical protein